MTNISRAVAFLRREADRLEALEGQVPDNGLAWARSMSIQDCDAIGETLTTGLTVITVVYFNPEDEGHRVDSHVTTIIDERTTT